jgi:hypothetical protein
MRLKERHVKVPSEPGEGEGVLVPAGIVVELAKGEAEDGDAIAGGVGRGFDQVEESIGGGVEL